MFCLSDSHISDIRHCFHYCNKDYKSESVNGSSTTCLSFCYIQTDITAVLPPGRAVLHDSSPNTPSKAPRSKKHAKCDATDDLTLSQVQQNIIQIIRQSSEEIKDIKVKENSNSINLLKEALEVVHSEIFDIRKENLTL